MLGRRTRRRSARGRRIALAGRSAQRRASRRGHLPMWDAPELVAQLLIESSAAS
jgi:hypothetical protein